MKVPGWTEVASIMVQSGDTHDVLICLSGPPLFFLCGSHLQMGALEQRQGAQSPMGPHLTDFSWPGDITTRSLSRLPDNVIFNCLTCQNPIQRLASCRVGPGSSMNNTSQLNSWSWTTPSCLILNVLVSANGEEKWTGEVSMASASTDAAFQACHPEWLLRETCLPWRSGGAWREALSAAQEFGFPPSSGSSHTPHCNHLTPTQWA